MQPTPPSPPAVPKIQIPTTDGAITIGVDGASPSATYEAQVAARRELRNQLDRLQDQRNDVSGDLRNDEISPADRTGLEARIKEIDGRISALEGQIAQADAAVAKAAGVPGAIVEKPPVQRSGPPEEVFAIPIVFTIFVLAPIAIAYARRIWKRGNVAPAAIPKELTDRMEMMGQAVESIAIEVERIGEGQRFITKVMGERQLGAGAAQPIQVAQGQRVEAQR